MTTVGERIKLRRKELGLSVDDVAERLGKNRATIYRYESDYIENLPITIINPLAEALQTTPAYLMGWDEVEENKNKFKEFAENWNLKFKEKQLLENYRKLNDLGKEEADKRVAELTMIPTYTKINDNVTKLTTSTKEEYNLAAHDDGLDL